MVPGKEYAIKPTAPGTIRNIYFVLFNKMNLRNFADKCMELLKDSLIGI
jgi:hypothetical protein